MVSDVASFTPGFAVGGFLLPVAFDPVASGSGSGQGDTALGADIARSAYGVDGSGVKIGILSNSFNANGGMASDIANGYLPADTTILKDMTGSAATDEGRALAQVAHDVAPGSSIAFYTANVSEADCAAGILSLFNAGCKVIVDDITYFDEPFFQSDAIAQAIDTVVSQGAVFFTSAGNDANNSYQSAFRPVTVATPDGQVLANAQDFDPGPGISGVQNITIGANTSVTFVLQWDQPYGAAATDMEMRFYAGGTLLGSVDRNHSGSTADPIVGATITTGSVPLTLQVAIDDASGPLPGLVKYVAYANGAPVTIDTFSSPGGTVVGHHMDANALTIGAAAYTQTSAFGVDPPQLEWFSSSGDAQLLFDASGNRLSSPQSLDKIDLVAPDGVSTSVAGLTPFFGTSAAVPGAAGVAALMLQANGLLNAQDVGNLMKDSATDMGAVGYDFASGYGLIQANEAVGFAATQTITGTSGNDTLFGTHLDDTIVGGAGNDTLIGGAGRDTFIERVGQGSDVIQDFAAGIGGDIVKFVDYGIDFSYVQSHFGDLVRNAGTLLPLPNGETLTFLGVPEGAFTADNFLFDNGGVNPSSPGGSGPDTLVLHLSEDAWSGDAQFTLDVDGARIAGPTSVTVSHSSGNAQDFTYHGSFGAGPHTVAVHFINDAWGGTAATDRNLYVEGIDFNGQHYAGTAAGNDAANGSSAPDAAVMAIDGTVSFPDVGGASAPPTGTGPDTMVLHLSEDAWSGDAQFTLDVDGTQIAGPTSVMVAHGSGNAQNFTYHGSFGAGPHTVAVHFINDAWGGTAATDRNLYVEGIDFNGQHYAGTAAGNDAANGASAPDAAVMAIDGTVSFPDVGVTSASQMPMPPSGGGADTLVLHLSEDAWNGDAQFTVDVDGTQIAGPTGVVVAHSSGVFEDFTYNGNFGAGPHTVAVHFVNDAWGGTAATDRNLYVGGIDFNGQHYAGQNADNDARNGQPDVDPHAAEMLINGTVTFHNVGSSAASDLLV